MRTYKFITFKDTSFKPDIFNTVPNSVLTFGTLNILPFSLRKAFSKFCQSNNYQDNNFLETVTSGTELSNTSLDAKKASSWTLRKLTGSIYKFSVFKGN